MRRALYLLPLALLLCGYSPALRQACEADARRLCYATELLRAGLGDYRGMTQCFARERAKFSRGCLDAVRAEFRRKKR